jgi:hypothetical protein
MQQKITLGDGGIPDTGTVQGSLAPDQKLEGNSRLPALNGKRKGAASAMLLLDVTPEIRRHLQPIDACYGSRLCGARQVFFSFFLFLPFHFIDNYLPHLSLLIVSIDIMKIPFYFNQ